MTDSTNAGGVIPLRINRFVGEVAAAVAGRKELKAAGDIALNDADAFASTCGQNGGGEDPEPRRRQCDVIEGRSCSPLRPRRSRAGLAALDGETALGQHAIGQRGLDLAPYRRPRRVTD